MFMKKCSGIDTARQELALPKKYLKDNGTGALGVVTHEVVTHGVEKATNEHKCVPDSNRKVEFNRAGQISLPQRSH